MMLPIAHQVLSEAKAGPRSKDQSPPSTPEITGIDEEQATKLEMFFCGPDADCNKCTQAHRDAFAARRAKLKQKQRR